MTEKTILHLCNSLKNAKFEYEIIVVDNGSTDGSTSMLENLKKKIPQLTTLYNKKNLGFPKGNNRGLAIAKGTYILFLNSDVHVKNISFHELFSYFEHNPKVGALTVKVLLPSGSIDPASHRGFPTVWNAFCYFTKLEFVFGHVPFVGGLFGGYHLTQKNLNSVHEIDSPTGAFYLIRSSLVKELQGFDERFFMYGEDLDLSYRVKERGYKVVYYPKYEVVHYKGVSGFRNKTGDLRTQTRKYFYEAMKFFYQKHYSSQYPGWFNYSIYSIIDSKIKSS